MCLGYIHPSNPVILSRKIRCHQYESIHEKLPQEPTSLWKYPCGALILRSSPIPQIRDEFWDSFQDALLSKEFPPPGVIEDWPASLVHGDDEQATRRIRQQTHMGRPCGSPAFIEQLEGRLCRILHPARREQKGKDGERQQAKHSEPNDRRKRLEIVVRPLFALRAANSSPLSPSLPIP